MNGIEKLKALASNPTETWLADLDRHALGVAEAMTAIHGGRYNVVINHETCLVMVVRILDGCSR